MPIIKSKTITASGYTKGAMQFGHVMSKEDGKWYLRYSQSYQFTNAAGEPVSGVQDKYVIEGEVLDTVIQTSLPEVWSALSFLYTWFDGEIKKQEGIK